MVATVLVVAAVAFIGSGGSHPRATVSRTTVPKRVHRTAAQLSTFLGPSGVEASWVIDENKLPGTTDWKIPPGTPENLIAGFADLDYAEVGDTVTFYVSTLSPTFQVTAYRMGWYGGAGGREIWTSGPLAGKAQPACPLTTATNMVSCDNWTPSFSVVITRAFVQGDYLFKLVGSGNDEGYVPLTIGDPTSQATYLVINRSFTEQAWNTWGGYSFYQGTGGCILDSDPYPVCNRARVVSFDRPYDAGYGASDFLGNEFPLIEYAEKQGLDVTYVTDVTLDADPAIALGHKVLMSLGHDEAWSYNERSAVVNAEQHGTNVIYFGAAAVLRHVRMQASPLGPEREEVDYRNQAEDPLYAAGTDPMEVTGNTFGSPPANLAPESLTGQVYSGYLTGSNTVPFVVTDSSAWVFHGTGLSNGSSLPGVVRSDIDHVTVNAQMPQDIQVLGHSPVPLSTAYTNQGTWGGYTYSDMTYYTEPQSEAGVIDTGTVNWIFAMTPCSSTSSGCPAATVQKITGNMLHLFGQGPAGLTTPSVANWQTVQPPGS